MDVDLYKVIETKGQLLYKVTDLQPFHETHQRLSKSLIYSYYLILNLETNNGWLVHIVCCKHSTL